MSRRAAFVFSSGLLLVAVACSAAPDATSVVAKRTPRQPPAPAPTAAPSLAGAPSDAAAPSGTAVLAPTSLHPGTAYHFAVDQSRWQLKDADGGIGDEVLMNGFKLAVRRVLRPVRPT